MQSGDPKGLYVETDCCTLCGVPWHYAPEIFAEAEHGCIVRRQPASAPELRRVLRVFQTQEMNCIRYGGDEPRVLGVLVRTGYGSQCDASPNRSDTAAPLPPRLLPRSDARPGTRALPLVTLVALDLVTKGVAVWLLPTDTPVRTDALFQVVLRINHSGLGTWARSFVENSDAEHRAAASFGYIFVGVALLLFPRTRWSTRRKAVTGGAIFLLGSIAGILAVPLLALLSTITLHVLARLGPVMLFVSLWYRASPGLWKASAMLFAAAALGNLLGLAIPPHAAIDFIYSSAVSSVFRQGVANLADLYFDAAIIVLIGVATRATVRRLRQ